MSTAQDWTHRALAHIEGAARRRLFEAGAGIAIAVTRITIAVTGLAAAGSGAAIVRTPREAQRQLIGVVADIKGGVRPA